MRILLAFSRASAAEGAHQSVSNRGMTARRPASIPRPPPTHAISGRLRPCSLASVGRTTTCPCCGLWKLDQERCTGLPGRPGCFSTNPVEVTAGRGPGLRPTTRECQRGRASAGQPPWSLLLTVWSVAVHRPPLLQPRVTSTLLLVLAAQALQASWVHVVAVVSAHQALPWLRRHFRHLAASSN